MFILIQSIPGNRSEEQAEFLSANPFPLAIEVCVRACVWSVFLLWTLRASLWETIVKYALILSPRTGLAYWEVQYLGISSAGCHALACSPGFPSVAQLPLSV